MYKLFDSSVHSFFPFEVCIIVKPSLGYSKLYYKNQLSSDIQNFQVTQLSVVCGGSIMEDYGF